MHKIRTLFEQDDDFLVTPKIRKIYDWARFPRYWRATEKIDGTNIRLTVRSGCLVRVEKRRNPNKKEKQFGILNPWYTDTSKSNPSDKYILEAAKNADVSNLDDGEYTAEAIGPKIQGNVYNQEKYVALIHREMPTIEIPDPSKFEILKNFIINLESKYRPGVPAEGIVLHAHYDMLEKDCMAKLRRKDFIK